jgi:hypothetical protein
LGVVVQRADTVLSQNRLFRSKSPSDRHPYSPTLAHSPLAIAQSDGNELLLYVCEFVGGLIMFGHGVPEETRFWVKSPI